MSVVIETTAGDLTVDLFLEDRPRACLNFLKLCKLKYYNYNLFHTIERGFIAQTGDPTGVGNGGESIWGLIEGHEKRFFEAEYSPKIRHSEPGLLSMVSLGDNMIGSQFFFTLGSDQTSLDGVHCVIGQVVEGLEVLRNLNEAICDNGHRPYQDIRITHTVILEDPFENPRGFREPSRSPSPSVERLRGGRIAADEDIDDTNGKTDAEINEMLSEREAKARATILEIVGDLPDADIAPPENVLFVCKLNSVTTDDDLEIIFSRFGKVKGCEVIRDRTTGDSLQYAFVEFEDCKSCEAAYFKMDNVLIDDRRIHVDFSQSVSKIQWRGKGRGLIIKDGSKNNRLDFSNYKEPVKRGGGGSSNQRNFRSNDINRRYGDNKRGASPNRDNRNDRRRAMPNSRDRQRSADKSMRHRSRSNSPLRRQRSRSRSPRQRQQRSRSPRQRQQPSQSPRRYNRIERDRNWRQPDTRTDRRPQSNIRGNSNYRRASSTERQRDRNRSKTDLSVDASKIVRRDRNRSASSSEGRSQRKYKSSAAKKSTKSKKSSKKSKKKNSKKHKKRSSSSSDSSSSSINTSSSSSS